MHFDYCTTTSTDFVLLDQSAFSSILQVGSKSQLIFFIKKISVTLGVHFIELNKLLFSLYNFCFMEK